MADLDRNLFLSFSSKGLDAGQRSEGVGLVAREEFTDKAKAMKLIGLCKSAESDGPEILSSQSEKT